jgi:hypothetical protein
MGTLAIPSHTGTEALFQLRRLQIRDPTAGLEADSSKSTFGCGATAECFHGRSLWLKQWQCGRSEFKNPGDMRQPPCSVGERRPLSGPNSPDIDPDIGISCYRYRDCIVPDIDPDIGYEVHDIDYMMPRYRAAVTEPHIHIVTVSMHPYCCNVNDL